MSTATLGAAPRTTQRDANGRFAAGNKGGPGNPFGRRLAAMREAVQRAVTVEDIEEIMIVLVGKAKEGDLAAAKLVLQYAVGKPRPVAEPDRVDLEEHEIVAESMTPAGEMGEKMKNGIPVGVASLLLNEAADAQIDKMVQALEHPEKLNEIFGVEADEEDRPLTPEEIAEAKADWDRLKGREIWVDDGVTAPSFAEGNGRGAAMSARDGRSGDLPHGPSFAAGNGGGRGAG